MIVVCGEALIDQIHNGDGTQRAAPGGGPFNTARALARLGPLVVRSAVVAADVVTVEGDGFGPVREPGDAVYLGFARGLSAADHSCKRAVWSDNKIVACVPAGAKPLGPGPQGRAGCDDVRVESGGRLVLASVTGPPPPAKRAPGPLRGAQGGLPK